MSYFVGCTIMGIVFAALVITIQGYDLITKPEHWALYGYIFGAISQSILNRIEEVKSKRR